MRVAVVVAGGFSERFGSADKAVAPIGDTAMIGVVLDRLEKAVDHIVINVRHSQRQAIEAVIEDVTVPVSFAIDPAPDRGPTYGLYIALGQLPPSTESIFAVGVDMPWLDPAVVSHLFTRLESTDVDAVVPRRPDGSLEVLHGTYRPAPLRVACKHVLGEEYTGLLHTLKRLTVTYVEDEELEDIGQLRTFEDVNTREEYERLLREG